MYYVTATQFVEHLFELVPRRRAVCAARDELRGTISYCTVAVLSSSSLPSALVMTPHETAVWLLRLGTIPFVCLIAWRCVDSESDVSMPRQGLVSLSGSILAFIGGKQQAVAVACQGRKRGLTFFLCLMCLPPLRVASRALATSQTNHRDLDLARALERGETTSRTSPYPDVRPPAGGDA